MKLFRRSNAEQQIADEARGAATRRVRMKTSIADASTHTALNFGDVHELARAHAEQLVRNGFAEPVPGSTPLGGGPSLCAVGHAAYESTCRYCLVRP